MRKLKLLTILLLSLMIGVAATAVQAEMMLNFLVPNTSAGTGTIVDVTNVNPLLNVATGTNIAVASVSGTNTPLNPGDTLTLTNAVLNFNVHYNAVGTNVADFISVSAGPTYLYAGFNQITNAGVVPPFSDDAVFYATFFDIKPPSVVTQYFGLDAPQYANMIWNGILHVDFNKGSEISYSGSIGNTPLPGSLLLLGSGILGLLGIGIRKRAKNTFKLLTVLLLTIMVGAAATAVQAQPMLDFLVPNTPGGTGTIANASGVATGTNIAVASVSGTIEMPNNGGTVLSLANTVLNFNVQYTGLGAPTGSITISSGSEIYLQSYDILTAGVVPAGGNDRIFYATFLDYKPTDYTTGGNTVSNNFGYNTALWDGVDWSGLIHVHFKQSTGVSYAGDIRNTALNPPAPIPGSVLLLGSGVLCLVGIGMRKKA